MKKLILLLTTFMLLGLSFAKAQLVTMYDLVRQDIPIDRFNVDVKKQFSLKVPNQNINIFCVVDEREIDPRKGKILQARLSGDGTRFNQTLRGNQPEDGLWTQKVGNRTHLVRIDSGKNKYVYAFFDDQPNPMDEFNKKLKEKGF